MTDTKVPIDLEQAERMAMAEADHVIDMIRPLERRAILSISESEPAVSPNERTRIQVEQRKSIAQGLLKWIAKGNALVQGRCNMTDRYKGFIVALERDIREDDAEDGILTALRMIKGVVSVVPIEGDAPGDIITELRVRSELEKKLWKALHDDR